MDISNSFSISHPSLIKIVFPVQYLTTPCVSSILVKGLPLSKFPDLHHGSKCLVPKQTDHQPVLSRFKLSCCGLESASGCPVSSGTFGKHPAQLFDHPLMKRYVAGQHKDTKVWTELMNMNDLFMCPKKK